MTVCCRLEKERNGSTVARPGHSYSSKTDSHTFLKKGAQPLPRVLAAAGPHVDPGFHFRLLFRRTNSICFGHRTLIATKCLWWTEQSLLNLLYRASSHSNRFGNWFSWCSSSFSKLQMRGTEERGS